MLKAVLLLAALGVVGGMQVGTKYVLTQHEQQEIVKRHNAVRSAYGSCYLQWDGALAAQAEASEAAVGCTNVIEKEFESVASNIFPSGATDIGLLVSKWENAEADYIPGKTMSLYASLNFIEMMWKSNTKIGCAACYTDSPHGDFAHLVCHYDGQGSIYNEADILSQTGTKGDFTCCSQPRATPCGPSKQCFDGDCHTSAPLTGCQSYGAVCNIIPFCNLVTQVPGFCPDPTGCPELNCVKPLAGFTCNECYIHTGYILCGGAVLPPSGGLCQSKSDPLYRPPHIWEPMSGTWEKTVKLLNDEREKRGQCPLEWDAGLAMDCAAGGVVGQTCATLTSDGDSSDMVWHSTFGGTPFAWDGDADEASDKLAEAYSQAGSLGKWVMADEAEKVGCCICREDIIGQATIVTSMCLARKAGGAVPAETISPVGSPKQACMSSGGDGDGMGPCTPTVVSLNGMPLVGTLLAAADLTKEHAEPLGTGHLVDFSNVAVAGAPDGEVVLLSGDKVESGDVLSFECPLGCDEECEVYLVAYHCPACPGSLRGGMVEAAKAAGWEVSSCAPVLRVGGEAYPTVSLRKVLPPGTASVFPSGEVKGVAVLTFRRELGVGCSSLGEVACGGQAGCTFKGGACLTDAWCPKRFGKGPFAAPTGPGCSAKCLA